MWFEHAKFPISGTLPVAFLAAQPCVNNSFLQGRFIERLSLILVRYFLQVGGKQMLETWFTHVSSGLKSLLGLLKVPCQERSSRTKKLLPLPNQKLA